MQLILEQTISYFKFPSFRRFVTAFSSSYNVIHGQLSKQIRALISGSEYPWVKRSRELLRPPLEPIDMFIHCQAATVLRAPLSLCSSTSTWWLPLHRLMARGSYSVNCCIRILRAPDFESRRIAHFLKWKTQEKN
jgi:hypothetical protein